MKIAVIGSRNFKRMDKITTRLINLTGNIVDTNDDNPFYPTTDKEEIVIISGGAKGVDEEAIRVARRLQYKTSEIKPNFTKGYDVREYHRRNDKIIDTADKVIAFWDGESKGTGSVIEKCLAKHKDIEVIFD